MEARLHFDGVRGSTSHVPGFGWASRGPVPENALISGLSRREIGWEMGGVPIGIVGVSGIGIAGDAPPPGICAVGALVRVS